MADSPEMLGHPSFPKQCSGSEDHAVTVPWHCHGSSDPSADLCEALDHTLRKIPMRLRCAKGCWESDYPWLVCLCNLNILYISSVPNHLSVLAQAEQMAGKAPLWQLPVKGLDGQTESLNQKTKEHPRQEGTLKDHLVQPFVGKGYQMRLSCILFNHILKTFGDGNSTTSLGRLLQWMADLTGKNSYITMKPLFVQLVPVALFSSPMSPSQERASVLLVAAPFMLEYSVMVPWAVFLELFSREKRPNSFSLPSSGRVSGTLVISTTLLWILSSLSVSLLNCGNQKCCLTRAE